MMTVGELRRRLDGFVDNDEVLIEVVTSEGDRERFSIDETESVVRGIVLIG